jgi:hypothetical protein
MMSLSPIKVWLGNAPRAFGQAAATQQEGEYGRHERNGALVSTLTASHSQNH